MRRLLALAILLILLLTACADEKATPPGATSPAPLPLEAGRLIPGCNTPDLENWYEAFSPNLNTFRTEAMNYSVMGQETMPANLNRLNELRDAITSTLVPECMADLQRVTIDIVNQFTVAFLAFHNGEIDQVALLERVGSADQRLNNEVLPVLSSTLEQLNRRLQEGN